jgi:hypothetical protein
MDITDWNEYAGAPNIFWAAPGDRILHREIPEQEEEFWSDFMQLRNGRGFSKIDCAENRETLLEKYHQAYGNVPVVCSQLHALWRKFVITRGVFDTRVDSGFINPHEPEEEVTIDPAEAEAARIAEYEAFSNAPDTSTKIIAERRRTDAGYARYYLSRLQQEVRSDDPMAEVNSQNNLRQPATTPTSRRVAPPEVQKFAAEYTRMSVQQVRTLLSPVLNPDGPAAAERNKQLFDQACLFGLV